MLTRALSYHINTLISSHNSSQTIYPPHKQVWKTWDTYRAVRGGGTGRGKGLICSPEPYDASSTSVT